MNADIASNRAAVAMNIRTGRGAAALPAFGFGLASLLAAISATTIEATEVIIATAISVLIHNSLTGYCNEVGTLNSNV
jgi:uncharacterized protein (DUF2062 family)